MTNALIDQALSTWPSALFSIFKISVMSSNVFSSVCNHGVLVAKF